MALDQIRHYVDKACYLVVKPGHEPLGVEQQPIMEADHSQLDRYLKGSLLLLRDGRWAAIPVRRAAIARQDDRGTRITVIEGSTDANQRDTTWLNNHVEKVWPGVLAWDGGGGANAKLRVGDVAALFAPLLAPRITHGVLTVGGVEAAAMAMQTCLNTLGLGEAWLPWGGGRAEPEYRALTGVYDPDTAACAPIGVDEFLGKGRWWQ